MINQKNKIVLIAGGAGDVGEEIVKVFLKSGAKVIVPSRSPEKLSQLREKVSSIEGENLLTIETNINTDEGINILRNNILNKFGGLTTVIASLGSWYSKGNLEDYDLSTWNNAIDGGLTAHFNIYRMAMPIIRDVPDSSYVFINGGAAHGPVPASGPVSVVASAQEMFKNVAASETTNEKVRVNSLMINALVETRARGKSHLTKVSATDVGLFTSYLASEHAAGIKGKTIQFNSRDELPVEVRS